MKPGDICRMKGTTAPAMVITEISKNKQLCTVEWFWNNRFNKKIKLTAEIEVFEGVFPNQNREDEMYV